MHFFIRAAAKGSRSYCLGKELLLKETGAAARGYIELLLKETGAVVKGKLYRDNHNTPVKQCADGGGHVKDHRVLKGLFFLY